MRGGEVIRVRGGGYKSEGGEVICVRGGGNKSETKSLGLGVCGGGESWRAR